MHPASVGFQCPECVAEGQRTQRQPRTMAGGLVPASAGQVTKGLIGINVVVFLAVLGSGGYDSPLVRELVLFSADRVRWPSATHSGHWKPTDAGCMQSGQMWRPHRWHLIQVSRSVCR